MDKLVLQQKLQHKLSPQQIQFIKLLQVPTAALETRVQEELEENPVLEKDNEEDTREETDNLTEEETDSSESLEDYLRDDYSGYKMQGDGPNFDEEVRELPIPANHTLYEKLNTQLGYLRLNEKQKVLGKYLIGNLDADGYIRRDLTAIVNDLVFSSAITTTEKELEHILLKIQKFDPPGIGARNLQECLAIQLNRKTDKDDATLLAERVINACFNEFSKKHYDKIMAKLEIEEEELKEAIDQIVKLNPKPGGTGEYLSHPKYLIPDFYLTNKNGKLDLTLNGKNIPHLRVSRSYTNMLDIYSKTKKKDKKLVATVTFIKQKLEAAKWFIDSMYQRQRTLLKTMQAIVDFQYEYFLEGDENKLKPMILKDISDMTDLDISTISRVTNSKSVQTDFGIFLLKHFFSEGIITASGEDVSSKRVKKKLQELIAKENKEKPLSDEKLEKQLNDFGYNIARRTVAKYREQLNIPVARLRRELQNS